MEEFRQVGTGHWDRAAAEAYRLERFLYRQDDLELSLSRPGRGQPWVSNPYGYVGGLTGTSASSARDLPGVLRDLLAKSQAPYALVRTLQPLPDNIVDQFEVDSDFHTFFLNLSGGADTVWRKRLASKVRRQTKRGFKLELETRFGHHELFDDFLAVLAHCWRDLGTPFHRSAFFRGLLDNYGPENSGIINLYANGVPVSTALLLVQEDTVFHPYTGTIKAYQRNGGNNVLYWRIIQWACERDYGWFDMGRSHVDNSVARYKRPWGVIETPLYYNYLRAPGCQVMNLEAPWVKLAVKAWKRTPLWFSRMLGPLFIRRVL
jgi:Acetyltransferase (GNAT) domain